MTMTDAGVTIVMDLVALVATRAVDVEIHHANHTATVVVAVVAVVVVEVMMVVVMLVVTVHRMWEVPQRIPVRADAMHLLFNSLATSKFHFQRLTPVKVV
ncbi:MAG: hypothetical protein Pars2KO_33340 [Parasphingorhabdus sp.]